MLDSGFQRRRPPDGGYRQWENAELAERIGIEPTSVPRARDQQRF